MRNTAQTDNALRETLKRFVAHPLATLRAPDMSFGSMLLLIGGSALLGVLVLLALYGIKSALGIDIFPDRHLRDFL